MLTKDGTTTRYAYCPDGELLTKRVSKADPDCTGTKADENQTLGADIEREQVWTCNSDESKYFEYLGVSDDTPTRAPGARQSISDPSNNTEAV